LKTPSNLPGIYNLTLLNKVLATAGQSAVAGL